VHIYIIQYAKHQASKRQRNGKHASKPIFQHEEVTGLWNQGVNSSLVMENKPGKIILKRRTKTCILIDVAIPAYRKSLKRKHKTNKIYEFM